MRLEDVAKALRGGTEAVLLAYACIAMPAITIGVWRLGDALYAIAAAVRQAG